MTVSLNLDKKLIFLVMTVSIVALSIIGVLSFNYADQILKQRVGDQLLGESTIRGETLRLVFESRIEQSSILTNDQIIRQAVSEMNATPGSELGEARERHREDILTQVRAFQELIGFSIGVDEIEIIGSGGDVFFSLTGMNYTSLSADPFFQRGMDGPFVDFEPSGDGKRMVVAVPIFAAGKEIDGGPTGVIVLRMGTAAIDSILLSRSGLGETGEVYIVNEEFMMLSESRFMDNVIFQTKVDTVGVRTCIDSGWTYHGLYPDYRGILIYGSSYCARDLGIVLLAEIDEEEIGRPIGILQDRILHTGIVITIGMGIAAFVISKSLSRPLIKLKDAANNIAGGNFGVRTGIRTRDEIGELSSAFDSMAEKLQESLIEIKEKEEVIKQQEEILLKFSQHAQNDCVGVIDMKDSTKIASKLSEEEFGKMYEIFLNFMAKIIRRHDGEVVKSIGDALMFRFPDIKPDNLEAVKNAMECCLDMIDAHDRLVQVLAAEGPPRAGLQDQFHIRIRKGCRECHIKHCRHIRPHGKPVLQDQLAVPKEQPGDWNKPV